MFFNKIFFAVLPFVLTGSQAQQISNVARASNFFPVSTLGTAAAVQVANSDTRIYYQPPEGGVTQLCVNNAFTTGGATFCNATVVPPAEVLYGTPIAGTNILNNIGGWSEAHVFYLSPDHILSEWQWNSVNGSNHGNACTTCVTRNGFSAASGSELLYAMANPSRPASKLRVGFISTGNPNTITEATFNANTNSWSLAVVPDTA